MLQPLPLATHLVTFYRQRFFLYAQFASQHGLDYLYGSMKLVFCTCLMIKYQMCYNMTVFIIEYINVDTVLRKSRSFQISNLAFCYYIYYLPY